VKADIAPINKSVILVFGVVLGIILTLVFFYMYIISDAKDWENRCSFVIDNEQKQERLVEAVANAGIDYRTDLSGQFWYACEDEKRVKEIAFKVMGRNEFGP